MLAVWQVCKRRRQSTFPLQRRLPNREKPVDVECCRSSVNGNPTSTWADMADDTYAASITEGPGAVNSEQDYLVPYEPVVGQILGEGSTSRIALVAPGVIIKYPRFSWWDSKKAADNGLFKT